MRSNMTEIRNSHFRCVSLCLRSLLVTGIRCGCSNPGLGGVSWLITGLEYTMSGFFQKKTEDVGILVSLCQSMGGNRPIGFFFRGLSGGTLLRTAIEMPDSFRAVLALMDLLHQRRIDKKYTGCAYFRSKGCSFIVPKTKRNSRLPRNDCSQLPHISVVEDLWVLHLVRTLESGDECYGTSQLARTPTASRLRQIMVCGSETTHLAAYPIHPKHHGISHLILASTSFVLQGWCWHSSQGGSISSYKAIIWVWELSEHWRWMRNSACWL